MAFLKRQNIGTENRPVIATAWELIASRREGIVAGGGTLLYVADNSIRPTIHLLKLTDYKING